MDDERLIHFVRIHPELYDVCHKKYSDVYHKDTVWKRIGTELRIRGTECKTRWTSLRDQYRKSLRKNKIRYDQGPSMPKRWRYEDHLSFMIPFFKERGQAHKELSEVFNEGEDGSFEGSYENMVMVRTIEPFEEKPEIITPSKEDRSQTTVVPNERRRMEESYACEVEQSPSVKFVAASSSVENTDSLSSLPPPTAQQHPIDAFFNGLAATVKQFPPYYQNLAKSKMFNIVSEIELKLIQQSDPSQFPQCSSSS